MSSKRLEAILGSVPSATAKGEFLNAELISKKQTAKPPAPIEYTRIVATIPQQLKDEIRQYIKANKGDTETTLILKSLKKMGFNVDPSWMVDKRSIR